MRRPFLTTELTIIKLFYPDGGAKACAPFLNRSIRSIQLFAWKQGIKHNIDALNEKRRQHILKINESRKVSPPPIPHPTAG